MVHKVIQQQTAALLESVEEGIGYAGGAGGETFKTVLESVQIALGEIARVIQEELPDRSESYSQKIGDLRRGAEEGLLHGAIPHDRLQAMLRLTAGIREEWAREPTLLEVAFFPYKASMWDSMDSIWRAADADPACDCYVVPIPYHERNPDYSLGTRHYEGGLFPPDVPVVDYESYDAAERRPDIIYIHNPYDEINHVTSVDPRYYSSELKKHTGMLAYVPYYIGMTGGNVELLPFPVYRNADRIIVQSEQMRLCLSDAGAPKERILVLGSPKLDHVINHRAGTCPANWTPRLKGRTVFLLNSSLTDLLGQALAKTWLSRIRFLLTPVLESKDRAVIWRPHPLMEATIRSLRPDVVSFYEDMKRELLEKDNFVLDQNASYLPAFDASHALISDHSSVLLMYAMTGKPVLVLTGSKSEKEREQYVLADYYDFYFYDDGFTVERFIDMVEKGLDPDREKRLASLSQSLAHMDGTAGENIHREVLAAARGSRER